MSPDYHHTELGPDQTVEIGSAAPRSRRRSRGGFLSVLTVLVAALLLAGCAASGGTDDDPTSSDDDDATKPGVFDPKSTMAAIQQRGKLIVGVRFDAAPFSSKNPQTGAIEGFDIDIVNGIARGIFGTQLEGKIEWVNLDPRDRELALEQNRVDMAVGRYDITIPRKKFVDFAGPYYVARQALVYDDRAVTDTFEPEVLQDFNVPMKLCTVRSSTNYEALKATLPSADSSTILETPAQCAAQLLAGRVQGMVADFADLIDVRNQSQGRLIVMSETFGKQPYGIGLHKGTDDLRKFINDRLDGPLADTWDQYLSTDIPGDGSERPRTDRY